MNPAKKITILIADDHVLVRESLSSLLNENSGLEVIGGCSSGEEAIEKVKALRPEVIIMDINLPGMDGIEATKKIIASAKVPKIIGISCHVRPDYALRMMKAGALAYVTKNSPIEEMLLAIGAVADNKKYICQEVKERISEDFISTDNPQALFSTLSEREASIVSLICKGLSSREISETLFIATKTVEAHRHHVFKKLKVNKTVSLINLFHQSQA